MSSGSDYGMQIRNDNDTVIWDSRNSGGGVVAEIFYLANTDTVDKTYPDFVGRNIEIIILSGQYANSVVTTDVDLGYPRIRIAASTITYGGRQRTIMVVIY